MPIAVKDEMDIGGEITSRGTGAFRDPAPRRTPRSSERLRAAGAIVVGKTTMPELGLWPFTESITWGVTRNPWDTDRTPGGSSGGSAAAVAAGPRPRRGGRRRRGLDPHSRPPAAGSSGSSRTRAACRAAPHDDDGGHWVCFGGLTRSVEDAALMYDVMAPGIGREQPRALPASPTPRPSLRSRPAA